MRPPDAAAGEDDVVWLERARAAAMRAPFGLHTHWTSPTHARPTPSEETPAARVRREVAWLQERGLAPALFAGGGWYIDGDVAEALAELGLADCTGTAFRPSYLAAGALRLAVDAPARLVLPSGRELVELPATHSLGMLARGILGPLPPVVHAYFHDTDLQHRGRAAALEAALRLLALRRRPAQPGLTPLKTMTFAINRG